MGEENNSGVGVSYEVILKPSLNKQVLSEKVGTAMTGAIDNVINDLTKQSQNVAEMTAP